MSYSLILVVLSLCVLGLQACSGSSSPSSPPPNSAPIEIRTLGALSMDNSGTLSASQTGVQWKTLSDQVPPKDFYQRAYQKGCGQAGQPNEILQIDRDLKIGQKFRYFLNDLGQDYQLSISKERTLVDLNRATSQLTFSAELLNAIDSRIVNYKGPLVLANPYEKLRMSLVQKGPTSRPEIQMEVLESRLHPDLLNQLNAAAETVNVDCHMPTINQATEVLAFGEVKTRNGRTVKAYKKTKVSKGIISCKRKEYDPFSRKNEFEKVHGLLQDIGAGKFVHMVISSNDLPSSDFRFCGGTQLLDFKLLVLDDGRVIQQRIEVSE